MEQINKRKEIKRSNAPGIATISVDILLISEGIPCLTESLQYFWTAEHRFIEATTRAVWRTAWKTQRGNKRRKGKVLLPSRTLLLFSNPCRTRTRTRSSLSLVSWTKRKGFLSLSLFLCTFLCVRRVWMCPLCLSSKKPKKNKKSAKSFFYRSPLPIWWRRNIWEIAPKFFWIEARGWKKKGKRSFDLQKRS